MNQMTLGQLDATANALAPTDMAMTGLIAGTIVLTLDGEIPVEFLSPGDRIITRDAGAQTLHAVQTHRVDAQRTIRINAHALDKNRPTKDIVVAEEQPILLREWLAKALYGQSSSMTPARCLIDGVGVAPAGAGKKHRIFQLCFEAQHVIYADGLELASAPVPASANAA